MNKKITSLLILFYALLQPVYAAWPSFAARRKNMLLSSVEQPKLETSIDANTPVNEQKQAVPQVQEIPPAEEITPAVPKERQNTPEDKEFRDIDAVAPAESEEESEGAKPAGGLDYRELNPTMPEQKNEEKAAIDEDETIDFNFENTSLQQLVEYIADVFHYQFISPEILSPLPQGEKSIKGNIISFKTNRSLSKKEAWNLFLTFLNMAGFGVAPDPQPNTYRILAFDSAKRAPLPTFIGVDINKLPDDLASSEQLIRYVYFVENTTTEALKPIIDQMKSATTTVLELKEHQAFLMIDSAYNITSLMRVIKELDKVSMPQTMSVLKLRRAGAKEVANLYQALIKGGSEKGAPQPNRLLQKKQPTSYYFPENVKVIAEERTNSLILLGPIESIKKIEDFIIQYIDVELDKTFSPLFVYDLRYAEAARVAEIMTEVTQIGKDTGLRTIGGLRGTDKYLKPMTFTPDKETNRIIIKGDYEDYVKAKKIIEQLDEPQAQVAIEILILALSVNDMRILGSQLRTKEPGGTAGLFGQNVTWQTTGLFGGSGFAQEGAIVNSTGSGATRLLGDLINLVTTAGAGSTILSLGDAFGAYAIIQALESINSTQTVANPFLLATNRTPAKVEVGITERVVASQIVQTGSSPFSDYKDEAANLTVKVTPTINSDGMISLDLDVSIETFLGTYNVNFVQKSTQAVKTKTVVADKEVIAIGGLVQDTTTDTVSKVPILGDLPLIGWLFKNRNKQEAKTSLLILVNSSIVRSDNDKGGSAFTLRHINKYEESLSNLYPRSQRIDPIHRWFFEERQQDSGQLLDDFVFNRHPSATENMTSKKKRPRNKKNAAKQQNTGAAA